MTVDVVPFGWVNLQLLGHRVVHGHVSQFEAAPGQWMLRLDVPAVDDRPARTEYYGFAAVYGIQPTTEDEVIKALTPWRRCEKPVNSDPDDPCTLERGHDGEHEGLPF